jgi:DNA-binding NtrC family response regulator
VITDQTMPQLAGLDLARAASAARPGLAVLLYTGHTDAVDAAGLHEHGVRALLRKPVDAIELRALLQRCLGERSG